MRNVTRAYLLEVRDLYRTARTAERSWKTLKILFTVSWRANATPLPVGVLEASSGLRVGLSHVADLESYSKRRVEWEFSGRGSASGAFPPLL